jgi:hypothetical protein
MNKPSYMPHVGIKKKKVMPEKEKSRDIWDKLQIAATLFSTLVIGIAGIYFTNSYNKRQLEQTKIQQAAQTKLDSLRLQTETVEAQSKMQAAQLEAMTKLAPYLSSKDKMKREVAYAILQSVDAVSPLLKQSKQPVMTGPAARVKVTPDASVYGVALRMIKENMLIATNPTLAYDKRIGAFDKVVKLALDKTNAGVVQNAAATAVEAIRKSPNSPLLGIGFDLADFRKYVDTLQLKSWRPSYIVLHHTFDPDLKKLPAGFTEPAILGFVKFFTEVQNWRGAPHLFIDDHKIWILNPLTRPGIHSPSWNSSAIGISLLGNYSVESAASGRGKAVLDNAIAAAAILQRKFNIPADSLKLHAEDKRSHKLCPGRNIDKEVFIARSKQYATL